MYVVLFSSLLFIKVFRSELDDNQIQQLFQQTNSTINFLYFHQFKTDYNQINSCC